MNIDTGSACKIDPHAAWFSSIVTSGADEAVGEAALAGGLHLGLEPVDEVDDVEDAPHPGRSLQSGPHYRLISSIESEIREMAKLLRANKIRSIGVSNFGARQMFRAAAALRAEGIDLVANQVQIDLLDRNIERNGAFKARCLCSHRV